MSDGPQGEGWWQASDGKWYPPSTAPATPPEAPTSPTPASTPPDPFAPGGGSPPPAGAVPGPAATGGGGGKLALVGILALVVGLLVGGGIGWAVAGSDDSDASTEWDAFCDQADELEALEASGDEPDEDEARAMFDELVDAAPERYQDTLAPLGDMMGDSSGEDMDAFGTAFTSVFWLVGVLEVECGIVDDSGGLFGGGDLSLEGSTSIDEDFGTGEALGLDDPSTTEDLFPDDTSEDDELEPMDIDAIQAWLEDNYGGEAWLDALGSWTVSNQMYVTVAPTTDPLSDDEALAACEAISEYVYDQEPEGSVTVSTPDGEPQAESEAGGACELVAAASAEAVPEGADDPGA